MGEKCSPLFVNKMKTCILLIILICSCSVKAYDTLIIISPDTSKFGASDTFVFADDLDDSIARAEFLEDFYKARRIIKRHGYQTVEFKSHNQDSSWNREELIESFIHYNY